MPLRGRRGDAGRFASALRGKGPQGRAGALGLAGALRTGWDSSACGAGEEGSGVELLQGWNTSQAEISLFSAAVSFGVPGEQKPCREAVAGWKHYFCGCLGSPSHYICL